MRPFLFLSLCLFFAACGAKKSSNIKYGETTKADLYAAEGNALQVQHPTSKIEVHVYADNKKYQIENDKVTNAFKTPEGDEKRLIFWQHKFKDCNTAQVELPHPKESHVPPEIELKCPEEGMSVIYTQGSDVVSRIIEYAKK